MLLLMKFSFKALTNCDNVVIYVFFSPDFLFKSYLTFSGLVLLLTVMLKELSKMTFPFAKMVCLSRPHPLKFFKCCLPQNLLIPLLNTLSHFDLLFLH